MTPSRKSSQEAEQQPAAIETELQSQIQKGKDTHRPSPPNPLREQELLNTLQRLQAEFQNYQKRIEKEKQDIISYGIADFLKQLLPIYEDFEKHIEHAQDPGLAMVFANFKKILEQTGVTAMECLNKPFDPYRHEVLAKVESDKPAGVIAQIIQKGYFFKGKILRHAKVNISSGMAQEQKTGGGT